MHWMFCRNQTGFKRNRALNTEENKNILEIKNDNSENLKLVCCALILLESFKEFELLFQSLGEEEQSIFKNWPIWNLYENKRS